MRSEKEILQMRVSEMEETIKKLQQPIIPEKWLDGADVKCQFNISDSTLARYRKNNTIPYSKLGNKYIYPESFFTQSLKKKMVNQHLM